MRCRATDANEAIPGRGDGSGSLSVNACMCAYIRGAHKRDRDGAEREGGREREGESRGEKDEATRSCVHRRDAARGGGRVCE